MTKRDQELMKEALEFRRKQAAAYERRMAAMTPAERAQWERDRQPLYDRMASTNFDPPQN